MLSYRLFETTKKRYLGFVVAVKVPDFEAPWKLIFSLLSLLPLVLESFKHG